MAVRIQKTDNGFLIYENTSTGRIARVWESDLDWIGEVCETWQQGETSPCYRMTKHDYSYRNLSRVLGALEHARDHVNATGLKVDDDDYLDLLTAIDDLDGVVKRIERIAD